MKYNRYNNGKIYKIVNNVDDMVYIGSTCLSLSKRKHLHKTEQVSGKSPNRRLFLHIKKYGWEEFDIYLVEQFSCHTKDQLRQREEYHRKQVPPDICLNMCRAFATTEDKKLVNRQSRERCRDSYNNYMRQFQQRPSSVSYRKQWEADNRDKRNMQQHQRNQYQNTWGGCRRNENNLLRIDTTLFT